LQIIFGALRPPPPYLLTRLPLENSGISPVNPTVMPAQMQWRSRGLWLRFQLSPRGRGQEFSKGIESGGLGLKCLNGV